MKTYIYDFSGYYIGAFMYVRAEDRTEADKMFKEKVRDISESLYHDNVWENGGIRKSVTVTEIKNGKRAVLLADGDY